MREAAGEHHAFRGLLLIKKSDIKTFFTLNKEARASLISGALTKLDPAQYEKALQRSVGRVMNLDVKAVDVNKVVRFFMPPPSFLGSAVLPFGLG